MKWRLLAVCFLLGVSGLFAQDKDFYTKGLVQLSGMIVNVDSTHITVPYATIQDQTRKVSDLSNYQGYFSFVVNEGDTIQVSSIGYDTYQFVVPKGIKDHKYTINIGLKQNIVELPSFTIFPWATIEQFNYDFMNMKFSDDEIEAARQNLNRANFLQMAQTAPKDGRVYQAERANDMHSQMDQRNKFPTTNFLSPFAWAKFINQISNSDSKKRKN